MSQEIILKVGDTVEYSQGRKGLIERIRIISTGKCVEEYTYDGDGKKLVLTLRDEQGIMNLWLKHTPIHKIVEKQGKDKAMSAFIRTIQGRIFAIDHNKKEISLAIEEVLSGQPQKRKIDFSLDSNVRITDNSNQQMKLVGLKVDDKVEIGYTRDKSQKTTLFIKVIG